MSVYFRFRNLGNTFGKELVFPFLAFGIPLLLRAIPEVLMGSYLVGFDTMGHHVPTTLLYFGVYNAPI